MMLNFLDNHDTPRFLRYVGGDKNALLSAVAALFMHPGMPCIFYGTEFPLDGAGDPDCRRTFDWEFKNADVQYNKTLRGIISLKQLGALQSGDFSIRAVGGLLVIKRSAQNEEITAYFNQTDKSIICPQDGKTVLENNCNGNEILPNGVKILMLNN